MKFASLIVPGGARPRSPPRSRRATADRAADADATPTRRPACRVQPPTTSAGPDGADARRARSRSRCSSSRRLRAERAPQIEAARGRVDQSRVAPRTRPSRSTASVGTGSTSPAARAARRATGTRSCGGSSATATYDRARRAGELADLRLRADRARTSAPPRRTPMPPQPAIGTTALDVRRDVEIAYLEAVARARLDRWSPRPPSRARTATSIRRSGSSPRRPRIRSRSRRRRRATRTRSRRSRRRRATRRSRSRTCAPRSAGSIRRARRRSIRTGRRRRRPSRRSSPQLVDDRAQVPPRDRRSSTSRSSPPMRASTRRTPSAARCCRRRAQHAVDARARRLDRRSRPGAAGLTLSWPLFDGGKSRGRRQRIASANVATALAPARRAARHADLAARVGARADRREPRERRRRRPRRSPRRSAQLKLADARYAQGLGSQIELADAQTAVTTAEGNLVTAEWPARRRVGAAAPRARPS